MAVATGTAMRTEPPPSKLDSGDASETSSAADAGGADAFDRSDSANSSPNPQTDAEIQVLNSISLELFISFGISCGGWCDIWFSSG